MKRSAGQVLRILRRSTALALACVTVWVSARTADLSGAHQSLQHLSQNAAFAVSLLSSQLPDPQSQSPLTGWQRLVLEQSALLKASAADLSALLPEAGAASQSAQPPDTANEDEAEPPIQPQNPEQTDIIPKTMVPSPAQSYLQTGDIYIANRAQKQVDVEKLTDTPLRIRLSQGPQILILHSHASEAYTPADADVYQPSDPYRTTDCNYNVVRVGEEMARVFREQGFDVIHDTTLYDYPSYSEAYDRSAAAVKRWLNQYPTIQVVLDVHRDALAAEDGTIYKAVSEQKDGRAAQVMLVVGTDGSGSHPLWQENLAFGMRLQQQLLDDSGLLARPMVLRASRFNQHLSVGSVLVEVGTHGNTLSEALLGAKLFAQSAAKVLNQLR